MKILQIHLLKRRFAAAMLMIWVFALGAAWANACLLQDRTTHLDLSLVGTAASPAVSPGHVGVLVSHVQNPSPSEAPCLKVCDDTSQSLIKWQPDTELPDMALLPSLTMAWSESVDARQPGRVEYPTQVDLPLRTRFSRLTL
jgi:hypothetical protein